MLGAPIFLQQRAFARGEDAVLALELGIVIELVLNFRQLDVLALGVVWLLHKPFGPRAFNYYFCAGIYHYIYYVHVLHHNISIHHYPSSLWDRRGAATTQAAAD